MDIDQLKSDLIADEGLHNKPYLCPAQKITIGVGRNLESLGLSDDEISYLLNNDINRVITELNKNIPWWKTLPEQQARAIANMCFNLGWPRLSQFKKMFAALQAHDYEEAEREALNSKWAKQVGNRTTRICSLIKGSTQN